MTLDWLELLFVLLTVLGGGALAFRRGRRRPPKPPKPPEPPRRPPPEERFDHAGEIEEVEVERDTAQPDSGDPARRWRDL